MTQPLAEAHKERPAWAKWLSFASMALAAAIGLLVVNSYPMMYPGYDVWWHLGVMQTGAAYDPSMTEYARWHRAWDGLLDYWGLQGIFERALIIHRVQFAITILSIVSASFLCLLAVFRERGHKALYAFASIVSAGIWLSMHGTQSATRFGELDSAATQSWIMWYSVNYQISLPFYFLATAGTLCLVSGTTLPRHTWLIGTATLAALGGLIYSHLAELPYYLFSLLLLATIYGNRRQKLIFFLGFALCLLILHILIPYVSHRIPELPKLLISGSYSEILQKIIEYGDLLVNSGLNRKETSWNTFYTCSAIALALTVLTGTITSCNGLAQTRAVLFLLATGLLPLALFSQTSAGVLSLITNHDLAWRFSFASFLYIGIPTLLVLIVLSASNSGVNKLTYVLSSALFALAIIPFRSDAVRLNVDSIKRSLSPSAVHFGLTPENRVALVAVAREMGAGRTQPGACFDIFSTYYLYYVLGQRAHCLPSSITSLPGAVDPSSSPANCECAFDPQFNEFRARGLPSPVWNFRFEASQ